MKTLNESLYHPKAALVLYAPDQGRGASYVEYFDMDENGCPTNPHPLTVQEARALAKSLQTKKETANAFLKPKGLLPKNVLYINPDPVSGGILWYTPPMAHRLHFAKQLDMESGTASTPALLWQAGRKRLDIYALTTGSKPTLATKLYHAPFFNVYQNGNVCMGSVAVDIAKSATLEEFIAAWEGYFFDSYFSHLVQEHNPVKGNIVQLWKGLIKTRQPFPAAVLLPTQKKLKDLLP